METNRPISPRPRTRGIMAAFAALVLAVVLAGCTGISGTNPLPGQTAVGPNGPTVLLDTPAPTINPALPHAGPTAVTITGGPVTVPSLVDDPNRISLEEMAIGDVGFTSPDFIRNPGDNTGPVLWINAKADIRPVGPLTVPFVVTSKVTPEGGGSVTVCISGDTQLDEDPSADGPRAKLDPLDPFCSE